MLVQMRSVWAVQWVSSGCPVGVQVDPVASAGEQGSSSGTQTKAQCIRSANNQQSMEGKREGRRDGGVAGRVGGSWLVSGLMNLYRKEQKKNKKTQPELRNILIGLNLN